MKTYAAVLWYNTTENGGKAPVMYKKMVQCKNIEDAEYIFNEMGVFPLDILEKVEEIEANKININLN
jgi:hypothetical protein